MLAAARSPDRIRRLILVAPVNPWSRHGRALAALFGHRAMRPAVLAFGPHLNFLYPWVLHRLYGDVRRIRPGTLEAYARPFQIPGALTYTTGVLQSWHRDLRELESALPRIAEIPTLLIWGDLDRAVDPHSAEKLQRQFTDSRLVMLQGVGHLPYEEVPDEFNNAVSEFLDRG